MKKIKFRITESQYNEIMESFQSTHINQPIFIICGQAIRENNTCITPCKIIKENLSIQELMPILNKNKSIPSAVLAIAVQKGKHQINPGEYSPGAKIPLLILKLDENKEIEGSVYLENKYLDLIDSISVLGKDILFKKINTNDNNSSDFTDRHKQFFGQATTSILKSMSIGIVGVSGTGSIVTELLTRLGVGELVLIDPDKVEMCNLNRIINSKKSDIGKYKTDVAQNAIKAMDIGTKVISIHENLVSINAVTAISNCDVIFGCVDSAEGRYLLNMVSTFYIIPYFDVGIALTADGKGGISEICGSARYVLPGLESLISREDILKNDISSDELKRTNPEIYNNQLKEKYIKGVNENSPAVISFNMFFASMVINEFLARIHPFREDENKHKGLCMSLVNGDIYQLPFKGANIPCKIFLKHLGKGDVSPLLERTDFSYKNEE